MEKTKIFKRKISLGQDNNALMWLIIINATMFVVINFIKVTMFLSAQDANIAINTFHRDVIPGFVLSGDFAHFVHKPWTLLSYMFTHESTLNIFSSLLWLWVFGSILQDMVGTDKIFPIYLYGGVVGGIVYLLANTFIPAFHNTIATYLMGSNAAIMAIVLATTVLFPNYRLLTNIFNGGIPLWVIAVLYIGVDFASIASSTGSLAIAHLSGALMGYVYAINLKKGNDWGRWMHSLYAYVNDFANPDKNKKQTKDVKQELFYEPSKPPYKKQLNFTQDHLDSILDKINQTGYTSLTEEEKIFLQKYSEDASK